MAHAAGCLPKRDTGTLAAPVLVGKAWPASRQAETDPQGMPIAGMLAKTMKPSFIVKYLDQYVIGQDDAKKMLAVAVYAHFKKIARARVDKTPIAKSNVLLIGPTGTGKTLLCETLSHVLEVPFVTAEATSLAQTRYVNDEIEAILQRLRRQGRRRHRQGAARHRLHRRDRQAARRPTASSAAAPAKACSTRC